MIVYVNGKKYRLKGISLAVVSGGAIILLTAGFVLLAYLPFILAWGGM